MTRQSKLWIGSIAAILVVGLFATADEFEPPDSAVNPQNQYIEIADPVWSGTNQDIKYVIDHGDDTRPEVHNVSTNELNDLRPRVSIAASGDALVAWWRDDTVDKVVVRKRNFADGTWDDERVLSTGTESSRNPVIAHDGTDAWVAYQFEDSGKTGIAVTIVIDEPDPIGIRDELAITEHDGPIDLTIYAEQGQLWVTWVDSDSDLGWVEYDSTSETWSLPLHESYAADSIDDARDRIRNAALGN